MDNRKLTFQEQYELRQRAEKIMSRRNANDEYEFLSEGDHAIYYVDFKNRELTSKELIDDKFSIFDYITEEE